MKVILAVSGGIDSMVMLDMIYRGQLYSPHDIIVAHFDHGIRTNSAADAEFVAHIAEQHGLEFVLGSGELGPDASEAQAREARYRFLSQLAKTRDATIFTAHHLDDLVESIAINYLRGTGWRGLAALDRADIRRPLLEPDLLSANSSNYPPLDKAAVFRYAAQHRLHFREDSTNSSDEYLRNRLRHQMNSLALTRQKKLQLYTLWQKQKTLKRAIDQAVAELLPPQGEAWQRQWFHNLDGGIALELLRAGTLRAGISATRPQLKYFRQAILTYASGKQFNLPNDRLVRLTKNHFWLD